MKVNYVTGNQGKFKTAEFMLQSFGIELEQKPLDIILRQVIVYIDENQTKTFTFNSSGRILDKVTGNSGRPSDRVISLSKSGRSIAEEKEQTVGGFSLKGEEKLWQDFGEWLREKP